MKTPKTPQDACTICGTHYGNIAFKGGYICENCIDIFKNTTAYEDSPK